MRQETAIMIFSSSIHENSEQQRRQIIITSCKSMAVLCKDRLYRQCVAMREELMTCF